MSRPVFASTTFLGSEPTLLADALAALDGLGLDGVELGSTHRWQADIEDVARRAKGRVVTHNYFPPAPRSLILNLASADATILAESRAHALTCIEMAARLEAELYTVHPGFLAEPETAASSRTGSAYDFTFAAPTTGYEQAFATMAESLALLLERGKDLGVPLAIETEGSVTKQGILLMERPDEYQRLFGLLPDLAINLNVAHSTLAAKVHGFAVDELIALLAPRIRAVELSHNDGHYDQHLPLVEGSPMLPPLALVPAHVPAILEFREASPAQVAASAEIVRAVGAGRR